MKKGGESESNNILTVDFKAKSGATRAAQVNGNQPPDELTAKKIDLFECWLDHGTVNVLFDARKTGVSVPLEFKVQGDLRLNFCRSFQIPDFNWNTNGVWATLSFDSGEQYCMVPWNSIYGLQSQTLSQGAVWFESFPADYDQMKVLGFTEDMCETPPEREGFAAEESHDDPFDDNIVSIESLKKSEKPSDK